MTTTPPKPEAQRLGEDIERIVGNMMAECGPGYELAHDVLKINLKALVALASPQAQAQQAVSTDEMMLMAESAGIAPNTIMHWESAFHRFAKLLAARLADRA